MASGVTTTGSLTNARHELFAQELAKGNTQAGAYRLAGYADTNRAGHKNASRMMTNDDIQARVAALQDVSAVAAGVTIASLTAKLEAAYDLAMAEKSPAAAVSAVLGIAKLHGLLVERSENLNSNLVIFSNLNDLYASPDFDD